ncbi:hypothetical protein BS78_05G065200 [Paspalum vaginatum]|nr:hypothetical protein BS78_05G065200 [Paspalum vaginatum]
MGSVTSIHRRPPRVIVPPAASKPKAMVPELLELGLQALFAPATTALLAANVLVFFRPGPLDGILPTEDDIGFDPADPKTMLSAFYHVDQDHLLGNMEWLLHLGTALESSMGTADFASMVAALVGLSHGIAVLLSKSKAVMALLGLDADNYYGSIGFSGIIFAMDAVLACSRSLAAFEGRMSSTCLESARVLCKLGMCADLFIAQALVPEADFLGHLAGLLAGFLYHLLKRCLEGADPLAWLISRGVRSLTSAATRAQEHLMSSAIVSNIIEHCCSSVTAMTAAAGGGDGGRRREYPRGIWTCSTCNNYNSLAADTCEMCSTVREGCAFSWRRRQLVSSSSSTLVVLRSYQ